MHPGPDNSRLPAPDEVKLISSPPHVGQRRLEHPESRRSSFLDKSRSSKVQTIHVPEWEPVMPEPGIGERLPNEQIHSPKSPLKEGFNSRSFHDSLHRRVESEADSYCLPVQLLKLLRLACIQEGVVNGGAVLQDRSDIAAVEPEQDHVPEARSSKMIKHPHSPSELGFQCSDMARCIQLRPKVEANELELTD